MFKRIFLLVLVSMIFSVVEMTVDPGFFVGRIFLAFSGFLMVLTSLTFVKDLRRAE
ncbi:hypothetical protein ACFQAV_09880 [Companilactobacillus huachuanensis]|uniref:DUF1056 family protein n=1 Tax=Companilactobacillus huachuanensis TaxID=2559914 RepID=A0ABW1RMR3_9LACO|nr:hypothetical protein [Companilactobacillus huachuanensis]